jgi:hypothetical protein
MEKIKKLKSGDFIVWKDDSDLGIVVGHYYKTEQCLIKWFLISDGVGKYFDVCVNPYKYVTILRNKYNNLYAFIFFGYECDS